jgi:hypothetical protein
MAITNIETNTNLSQVQQKKKQPSKELVKEVMTLYKEISNSIPKIKELYEKVDGMALSEGFAEVKIYNITHLYTDKTIRYFF